MLRLLLAVMLLCCLTVGYSQPFKKGYYTDNDNHRTECLIKRTDWTLNPNKFYYKLSDTDSVLVQKSIADVTEMGIYDFVTYKRFTLPMERSYSDVRLLDYDNYPKWKTETLWLKLINKGDANLYVYTDGAITKYFFETKNRPAKQLLHLRYLGKNNDMTSKGFDDYVYEMNEYKKDLSENLKCEFITYKDLSELKYNKKALMAFFNKYNNCVNSKTKTKQNKLKL